MVTVPTSLGVPLRVRHLPLLGLAIVCACQDPGPEVISAEQIGVLEQSDAIQGRDGGLSAVAFGKSVWVYGDTVLTIEDEFGRTWHHNSVSMTEDFDASDGITGFGEPLDAVGAPRHLVPPSPEEKAFNDAHWGEDCAEDPCGARWAVWPGNPIWDEAGQRALIFYGLIYAEPGDFNFEGVGQSIAIWDDPDADPVRPVVDADAEHPDLVWTKGEPGWGIGANIVEDHVYAFACDDPGIGHPCRLARASMDAFQTREGWRYWDGTDWHSDMSQAEVLFEGAPIMEVSHNEHLDAWLVVYSPPFDHDIVARTAPELTGPWSKPSTLYRAEGEHAPYDAVHHPEYEEDGGRVQYVTYSRPTEGWFGAEFPIVRVELE